MKVVLRGVEHDLDIGSLTFDEGCHIEDVTGGTFTEFSADLSSGSVKALRAYALVLLRRSEPAARIEDVGAMSIMDLQFIQEPADRAAGEPDLVGLPELDPTPAA
jgi:hypothetical protein